MSEQQLEMIELGCLLFFSAYHIILYFQVRRKYYLYLGLLGLVVLVRATLVHDGSGLFFQIFSEIDTLTGRKIEYLAAYSALVLMPLFINDLYTFPSYSRYVKFFQYSGLTLITFVLLTPYQIYRETLNIYHLLMIGGFLLVFVIIYEAIRRNQTGAKFILYGVILCFGFVMVEMIKNSRVIPYFPTAGPNLVNTGVLIYFFFQSIALSAIFARSFRENNELNKELEERVSARTEQLSKSNLVKERFIRIVSHDLRSPLGTLQTTLALLDEGILSKKQTKELFRKISLNLDGISKMLDDLLDWTRATSGSEVKIHKEVIDLDRVIAGTIILFDDNASQKKIDLYFKKPLKVQVYSDNNAIKVILRNLISNAIKFTKRGGKVIVSYKRKSDVVEVSVADTGIGIPSEMKESIFHMNSKNRRMGTNNEKSTGIGLALCYDLTKQIGEKIWVEDNGAVGSVFKFTITT